MNTREELRRSAGEYVLGTLDAGERAAMRDWMAADPEVAELVRMWERRFAPLLELSAPARLPSTLLDDILSKLPLDLPAPSAAKAEAGAPAGPAAGAADGDATPEAEPPPAAPFPDPAAPEGETPLPVDAAPPDAEAIVSPDPAPEASDVVPAVGTTGAEEMAAGAPPAAVGSNETVVARPELLVEAGEGNREGKADGDVVPAPAPAAAEPPAPPDPGQAVGAAAGEPAPAGEAVSSVAIAVPAGIAAAEEPERPGSSVPPLREAGGGWRRLSGVLLLALLVGAGAVAYRELHRPDAPVAKAVPEPPETPVAIQPFPEPPAPPPAPEEVADAFAVLGPQPVPGIGLTLDVDAGMVTVLKLPAPPGEGMRYDLWLVTEDDGPRRLASFRETGSVESLAVRDLEKERLADTFLMITREPEGQAGPLPTGASIYSGMAVAR